MNTIFIYVLELEEGKYYVGKTLYPEFRLDQHFNSTGAEWTKKYKPLQILQIIPDCDDFDEDKYTLKCMEQYGINNVRGGSFCEIKLSENNIEIIKKMINSSTDKCFICGEKGHFAKECKKDNDNIFARLKSFFNIFDICFTCYRRGHNSDGCREKTTIFGGNICDPNVFLCNYCGKEFETSNGASYHERMYCKKNKNIKSDKCYRCGRHGHYASNCYASKHINGKILN